MCRWMVYSGDPALAEALLFRPAHSLINQSLRARLGEETTNGDGFGMGWFGERRIPAVYKSINPAWSDPNLLEISREIRTPLLFAHVRASTGAAVQRSNCHPFRHGRWLWMHNGSIADFTRLKRDVMLAVDPSLYAEIEGTTDSEALFYLSLTFGLMEDPPGAVARAIGFVEDLGRRYGVPDPLQMTVATTQGESIWVFRYSSLGRTRSLFCSTDIAQLRRLYPELDVLQELGTEARFVVSEPIHHLEGAWKEVPESSYAIVRPGVSELHPLVPLTVHQETTA
ncbi:class II glutamine amidotransferase [Actinomadura sp. K4S16]|uniref:class II glutamine amidotransferase n=1 Tax=Actinomadura sp. K4S16 TaxID=1316147 RepID=UPI00190F6DE0|nr:class II glutamine amidotransferase [Actinomadura sp. K4S16]